MPLVLESIVGIVLAVSPPAVRLEYILGEGAERCPDTAAMQSAVRARLGFDPFREPAELRVIAQVGREGEGLKATLRLERDGTSEPARTRELFSRRADCAELAATLQLAISIAIDPMSVVRAEAPPPSPEPVPPAPLPPSPPVVPAPSGLPPATLELGAGAVGSLGLAPDLTAGAWVFGGLRWPSFSGSLEVRADWPRTATISSGTVSASCIFGNLVACWRVDGFGLCGLFAGGAMRGAGVDVAEAKNVTTPFLAAGARGLFEWPSTGLVAGRVAAEMIVPFTRTTLRIGDAEAWTTPPIAGSLAISLVGRIP